MKSIKFYIYLILLPFLYTKSFCQDLFIKSDSFYIGTNKILCEFEECYEFPYELHDGKWMFVFDSSDFVKPAIIGKYKEYKPYGQWVSFYNNGNIFQVANFLDGKFINDYISFYSDGKIKSVGAFLFQSDSALLFDTIKNKNESLRMTMEAYFYLTDTEECKIELRIEPIKIGEWLYFNSDGSISEEYEFYDNFQKHYKHSIFQNNKLKVEYEIKNDIVYILNKYDDNWLKTIDKGAGKNYYLSNDSLTYTVCDYKNGLLNGTCRTYFNNKKLHSKTRFKNGKKHGFSKVWDEKGKLIKKNKYYNDKISW